MTTASRPVRKDVARNRALLLKAADELFAERGVTATLDDIAEHAGVGVATAYRHFANKQALLEALFEDRMAKVEQIAADAAALQDPRAAFEQLLYGVCGLQASDRGMREALGSDHGLRRMPDPRARLKPLVEGVVERAHRAGVLRPEITLTDVPMVLAMIGAVSDYAASMSSGIWRRYLDLVLAGMLAEGLPRRPVAEAAPDVDEVERVVRNIRSGHRHR